MDFALNEEQQEYKERCRTFAREVIRPAARKHDEEESIPWDVIKEARKQGFGGLEGIQRSAGDSEGQMQVISAEEFHWGCAGIALAISGSGLAAAGIASSGTPEQIGQWVPECFGSGDEIKLGAYAVTEPQAGSDVKSLKTTAKRDGDEWVLNGTKVFITNGGIADVHVVVATVDPTLGTRGQASFVIGKDTPGLSQGKKESKLGIRASHTAEIVLDDCRIPVENLLGGEEKLKKKLERGRSGQKSAPAPMPWRPSRSPGRWSAPRRSASPRPPTSGRSSTSTVRPRAASRSCRSSASSRPSPTSPPRSKPRACWSSAPPGWAATASRCAVARARCRSSRAAT